MQLPMIESDVLTEPNVRLEVSLWCEIREEAYRTPNIPPIFAETNS